MSNYKPTTTRRNNANTRSDQGGVMNLTGAFSEALARNYPIWWVGHRLRKSHRTFKIKDHALKYFDSLKAKTKKIRELRPPGELLVENVTAKNPIYEMLKDRHG